MEAAPNAKARRIAKIISIIAALSLVGAFLLPIPLSFKIPLSLGLIVAEMHTGASIIYFTSLSKFTRRLKVAYLIVCMGSLFIAAGTIQLLVVNAVGWQNTDWVAYGGTELPILVGLFLGVVGYGRFAKLLAIKAVDWATVLVVGICVLAFLVVPILPHVPKIYAEPALDIAMSLSAMQNIVLAAGIVLLFLMKRRAGPLYTPALAWTLLAFIFGLLATSQQFFEYLFLPDDHWYVTYRLYTISIGISGLFSLRAALMFSTVPSASKLSPYSGKLSFFGKPKWYVAQGHVTLIDVVTFVAGLSSDMRAVDPSLDRIRILTATMGSSREVTPPALKILVDVYCNLEDYLVKEEPVRHYEQKELRELVKKRFGVYVDQAEFWQQVNSKRPIA